MKSIEKDKLIDAVYDILYSNIWLANKSGINMYIESVRIDMIHTINNIDSEENDKTEKT